MLLVAKVHAQQVLTLEQAISLSLQQHPDLKSFVYSKDYATGMIEQAGVKSPMMVMAQVEDAMGTGFYSDISAMKTTLSLSWLLEDKVIDSKVALAKQQAGSAEIEKQVKLLDVAAQTTHIFITLLSQQEQLKLAKLSQYHAQQVLTQISQRVKAGRSSVIDELRAKADLSKKDLMVEDFIHEIEASKSQLLAQWLAKEGLASGDIEHQANFEVLGDLFALPAITKIDSAFEKLKAHPKLKLFATKQRIIESEIALNEVTANPSWRVSAGVKHDWRQDDIAAIASVSLPFGQKPRNQGRIAALSAQQNQQQADADAWYQRFATQILLLTHKLKHNTHVVEGLSEQTIPALELASDKAQAAYQKGSYSYTDWYAVQQELMQTKLELIEAYTNIQLFNIELERLTGTIITN